ncbi:two-component system, chemotaxis family, response regulator CheY [Belnapia rosea]|uniref:Two-component system, chemotaxis family, response regulator CheY n=1 Tax=Belnapia rosea TaxID=938405 RepID=A0A1G7CXY2_9PROT|nr:two-component system, chemotaxis family, response regulator CheY [Belnapia rosea]
MLMPSFIRDRREALVAEVARKRVLVVDDASLVRLYYRDALERAGYMVDEALNGLEALEKLLLQPADLLIVDVNMPQMDGFTFLKVLRRQELPLAGTPALVTSTECGPQDILAARRAGANFYLVKPLTQDILVEYAALLCGAAA